MKVEADVSADHTVTVRFVCDDKRQATMLFEMVELQMDEAHRGALVIPVGRVIRTEHGDGTPPWAA